MARSMNQTLAWISSGVLSIVLFGAGFAVFKLMVKGGGHAPAGSLHGGHGDEGHASGGDHGEISKGNASEHAAETHEPASHADHEAPHAEPGEHPAGDDGEISADQFKAKSDHH